MRGFQRIAAVNEESKANESVDRLVSPSPCTLSLRHGRGNCVGGGGWGGRAKALGPLRRDTQFVEVARLPSSPLPGRAGRGLGEGRRGNAMRGFQRIAAANEEPKANRVGYCPRATSPAPSPFAEGEGVVWAEVVRGGRGAAHGNREQSIEAAFAAMKPSPWAGRERVAPGMRAQLGVLDSPSDSFESGEGVGLSIYVPPGYGGIGSRAFRGFVRREWTGSGVSRAV